MHDTCVLLIGHGSREAAGNAEFQVVVASYRAAHPELRVESAYIELARPLLGEALDTIAKAARRIVVVPLFLFASGHVKNDIPLAIDDARRRFPSVEIVAAPPLGVHPVLVHLAWSRASSAMADDAAPADKTLLLVVGRGSSDPDANGDFCKMARLIGERRGLLHVEPTFLGITRPSTQESLELVARMRPDHVVVLPYLLFGGRLTARLDTLVDAFVARYPWIRASRASHLGNDDRLLGLIEERAQQALAGKALLPCDTCQYRAALPGLANQVGGLRALLHSVRHSYTHSQATMPLHTHKPLTKHVLVCGNADCVDRGSIAVLEAIRRDVKDAGRARDIKVTRTGCMGRCGEGPTVAVYPDGIWYRGVREADASEIVREHLIEDRLVGRLVDDILQ